MSVEDAVREASSGGGCLVAGVPPRLDAFVLAVAVGRGLDELGVVLTFAQNFWPISSTRLCCRLASKMSGTSWSIMTASSSMRSSRLSFSTSQAFESMNEASVRGSGMGRVDAGLFKGEAIFILFFFSPAAEAALLL